MSGYDTHPTRYTTLSNDELYSMYRSDVYTKLSTEEKVDLVQETVNRDAMERGMIGTPEVVFGNLPADMNACNHEGVIYINEDMALKGLQTEMVNGLPEVKAMEDSALRTLEAAIHENVHCWQEQILNGTITLEDSQLVSEYEANQFTETAVLQNGSYKMGSQYLKGITSYSFYYFQPTERDAHIEAEAKTTGILQALVEKFGLDKGMESYKDGLAERGYETRLQEAIQEFENSDFVKELSQTLMNQHYGTTVPVDTKIEGAVKTEMTETYQALQEETIMMTQEGKNIDYDNELKEGGILENGLKETEPDEMNHTAAELNEAGLKEAELDEESLDDDGLDDDGLDDDGLDDDGLDF